MGDFKIEPCSLLAIKSWSCATFSRPSGKDEASGDKKNATIKAMISPMIISFRFIFSLCFGSIRKSDQVLLSECSSELPPLLMPHQYQLSRGFPPFPEAQYEVAIARKW